MPKRDERRDSAQGNESRESQENRGYVKYIGLSHRRQMSQEDLQQAGFSGTDLVDLVWERANSFTVPRADIPDGVYERAVAPDLELILVDEKGQRM
jgi:hypothetical protein